MYTTLTNAIHEMAVTEETAEGFESSLAVLEGLRDLVGPSDVSRAMKSLYPKDRVRHETDYIQSIALTHAIEASMR